MDSINGAVKAYGPINTDEIKHVSKSKIKNSKKFRRDIEAFINKMFNLLDKVVFSSYLDEMALKEEIKTSLINMLEIFKPGNNGELFLKNLFKKSPAAQERLVLLVMTGYDEKFERGLFGKKRLISQAMLEEDCIKDLANYFLRSVKYHEPELFDAEAAKLTPAKKKGWLGRRIAAAKERVLPAKVKKMPPKVAEGKKPVKEPILQRLKGILKAIKAIRGR